MPVPSFEKKNWLASLGLQKVNTVFDIVRAFANFTVRGMKGAQFKLTDGNAILDLTNVALGGVGTAVTVFQFQPQTLHGDYYDAYQVVAGVVSSATTFHVLKPPKHRESYAGEVIDGNNFTYSYSTDNERTATAIVSGSPTEDQVSVPRFVVAATDSGSLTYAVQLDPSAQITISGVLCDWLEISPARVWCRKTGT